MAWFLSAAIHERHRVFQGIWSFPFCQCSSAVSYFKSGWIGMGWYLERVKLRAPHSAKENFAFITKHLFLAYPIFASQNHDIDALNTLTLVDHRCNHAMWHMINWINFLPCPNDLFR